MKKKIIITLSKQFPMSLSRRGEPTEFKVKLEKGEKLHTIRRNYDLWKINAEKMERGNFYLSVRQWSGRPYNSKQVEIAQIDRPIGVQPIQLNYHHDGGLMTAKILDTGRLVDVAELAAHDGLSLEDFREWFFGSDPKEDKTFRGVVIHFTDLRY